jgi:hypothetical protein
MHWNLPTKKKTEEWTTRLLLVGLGVFILYIGWANPVDWVVGVPLSVGPLIESVEFRDAFKLTINRVSGGKYFQQVEQKNILADNVITIQGDSASVQIGKKADYSPNELVEQVYTPLWKEATSWLDPATPTYTVGTWSNLETEKRYLTRLVPPDIAEIFGQAKILWVKMSSLTLALFGAYDAAIIAARDAVIITVHEGMNPTQAPLGAGQVVFRILSGPNFLGGVWLQKLWVSGKTLDGYAQEFVDANYPGTEWRLDVQIDGKTVGNHDTAVRFAGAAETFLRHEHKALEIRDRYAQMRALGVKARGRIDEELDKLVRLKA